MFVVSLIRDVIKVQPADFNKSILIFSWLQILYIIEFYFTDRIEALTDEIDRKYCNKVIDDVGLCICCYDIQKIGTHYLKLLYFQIYI